MSVKDLSLGAFAQQPPRMAQLKIEFQHLNIELPLLMSPRRREFLLLSLFYIVYPSLNIVQVHASLLKPSKSATKWIRFVLEETILRNLLYLSHVGPLSYQPVYLMDD